MRRAASTLFALALLGAGTAARAEDAPSPPKPRGPVVVSGFVHADWTVFRQTSQDEVSPDGQPLNEDRFLIRRARLRATAEHGITHAALEIEANTVSGPEVRPVNAEASLKWPAERPAYDPTLDQRGLASQPWFMVTAGLIPAPFGFEAGEGAVRRPFLETTSMSQAFFPGLFDLGARVLGGYSFVTWALGIMNGEPIGQKAFAARDPNKSKDLLFRLGGAGEVAEGLRIELGVSGLTGRGFRRGRPASADQVVWRDVNEDGVVDPIELQGVPGSPAEPSATYKRFAIGADARIYARLPVIGELAVRAELVRASNLDRGLFVADPVATGHDLRELGGYVGVTQEITRFAQVGARYDRYDPDADASERLPFALVPRDLSVSTWSFFAAARAPFGRLVAQIDLRNNALGRDATGAPTTLADDAFTLRAEARF